LSAARTAYAPQPLSKEEAGGAFFWLCAFFFVYCARPEDWVPGLNLFPLAKITGIIALLALLNSLGRTRRQLKDLPLEWNYLVAMIGVLALSAVLSPVWKGGAIGHTINFSKVLVAWALTFLLVTTFGRLRRIIFIQSASVVVICIMSLLKGGNRPRLEGVIGGIYSNPNDLAFAVVLVLPFCLAFMLTAKNMLIRLVWIGGMLIMLLTLLKTASRAGFIDLVISGAVVLWHFGVRGKRMTLLIGTAFASVMLLIVAGGPLIVRMEAVAGRGDTKEEAMAYESFEQRKYLMERAVDCIEHYPILGIGARNFEVYSLVWREVHMTYLQIATEGGIPSLILYLLFFARGFKNLRMLRKRKDLDVHTTLFVGGLHSSMIGFIVGASFAPEVFQFFPYFSVAYTSALVATIAEQEGTAQPVVERAAVRTGTRFWDRVNARRPDTVPLAR